MKIRAIELTNLRRFGGQRARIEGIGDGISVLSQPNEFGKSTFFDGLHALFFQPHRSKTAQTRALQPHAGGAPEVAVEVEVAEGRFRLEKRWLSRQSARVLDASGRVIAQEDEAEAWIDRVAGQGLAGQGLAGPSGLLWVRQGLLGLEPEGSTAADRAERDRAFATRRDLVSSVAGEIEAMTGGRRMDQVLARVNEALARLATSTLKPKAGGEWARAVEEAAGLEAARDALEEKARRLTDALSQRGGLLRRLQALSDPEAQAREAEALARAEAALQAAENHAEQSRKAAADVRLAQVTLAQARAEIRRIEDLQGRLDKAAAAHAERVVASDRAEGLVAAAAAEVAAAQGQHGAAVTALGVAADRVERARRADQARAARARAVTLAAQLAQAEAQRRQWEAQRAARAVLRVTPAALERAEAAQAVLDRLTAQDEARQVAVRLSYTGAARVTLEGQALTESGLRLQGVTRLDLPGIGQMTIDPGLGAGDGLTERIGRARQDLAAALAACAAPDLAAARRALAEAQRLDGAIAGARDLLAALAEGGIEALRARLASAEAEAGEGTAEGADAAADVAGLEAALAAAQGLAQSCLSARNAAEARHGQLREARAGAVAALKAAEEALEATRAEAGDPLALAAGLLDQRRSQEALAEAEAQAAARLAALTADAPDLETARAAVTRLRAVVAERQKDRAACDTALAGINGLIAAWADEGIEETLEELRGRAASAEARAGRYEREVKALALLRETLTLARRAARDTYFAPVLRELNPLLSILHPGAALQMDDASLLPVALLRDGVSEELEVLSGGTREQLAVLTRLAFARLFARAGRQVPVILDDALVHSDDDRIEAMFTALHRVAQDQQILVLTCRQRAFAALGGVRMQAVVTPL